MKKRYRWNYKKCFKNVAKGIAFIVFGAFIGIAPMVAFLSAAWK